MKIHDYNFLIGACVGLESFIIFFRGDKIGWVVILLLLCICNYALGWYGYLRSRKELENE